MSPSQFSSHGCSLEGNFQLRKGRESAILGVWAVPGVREALPKGGGLRPPPFGSPYNIFNLYKPPENGHDIAL